MLKIAKFSDFQIPHFQIFGSGDSRDCDIIVFVDHIPKNADLASATCKEYDKKISQIISDRTVNVNLGIYKDGYIVGVFKGSSDEVNNALYYTYDLHTQFNQNLITNPVKRDLNLKIIRSTRCILSFFSRTDLRLEIKASLKGDMRSRLDVLKKINFETMVDFPGKKESHEDIYKIISFQYGQLFSLIDGFEKESYTKKGISKSYPSLSNLINRYQPTPKDLRSLNQFNNRLISLIESKIGEIGNVKEY